MVKDGKDCHGLQTMKLKLFKALNRDVAPLNFEIFFNDNFLPTFCWLLVEPANQNMGIVEGGDVKLSYSPLILIGI